MRWEREKVAGDTDPDSGGNTIYLSPVLQVVFAPHWVVEISYQQVVYHNLYGTQLGETYKAIGGVPICFNRPIKAGSTAGKAKQEPGLRVLFLSSPIDHHLHTTSPSLISIVRPAC
jgi:hypothetical protein